MGVRARLLPWVAVIVLLRAAVAAAQILPSATTSPAPPQASPAAPSAAPAPSATAATPPAEAAPASPETAATPPPAPQPVEELSAIEELFRSLLPEGTPSLRQFGYMFLEIESEPVPSAAGDDYVLGAGDEIALYLWGGPVDLGEIEAQTLLTVDLDGTLFYAPVGSLNVSGLRVSQAREVLDAALRRKYRSFQMALAPRQLRSYTVFVAGLVGGPGAVQASGSLSLVQVLIRAQGVSRNGSLRRITVTHAADGATTTVDLYGLLVQGNPDRVPVREGDVVFVPPIGDVVALAGDVKRPGVYEVLTERTVGESLALAGGPLPSARLSAVRLLRFVGDAITVTEGRLDDPEFLSQPIRSGDLVQIGRIGGDVPNGVTVDGHVRFPGVYAVEKTVTLSVLLAKAGLRPDADMRYGEIDRQRADGAREYATFAPGRVAQGAQDVELRAGDVVRIYPFGSDAAVDLNRYRDAVVVRGAVPNPGPYAYWDGLRLEDIFSLRDLDFGTDTTYAEVVRRDALTHAERVVPFSPAALLRGEVSVPLEPSDTVIFFRRWILEPIQVSGEVEGTAYVPYRRGMRLTDALAAVEYRGDPRDLRVDLTAAVDSLGDEDRPKAIYLRDLLVDARADQDVELLPGDALVVRRIAPAERPAKITVLGEVPRPGTHLLATGMRLSNVLEAAGGYTSAAYPAGLIYLRPQSRAGQIQLQAVVQDVTQRQSEQAAAAGAAPGAAAQAAAAPTDSSEAAARSTLLASQRVVLHVPPTIEALRGTAGDIEARDGDIVVVPQVPGHVLVLGAAVVPGVQLYAAGRTVRYYLALSGGVASYGDLRDAYMIRAAGDVVRNRRVIFFNTIMGQVLGPGDAVVIPTRRTTPVSVAEAALDATQIASQIATTILAGYTVLERAGLVGN